MKQYVLLFEEFIFESHVKGEVLDPTPENIRIAIDSNYRYKIMYQGAREDVPHERSVDFYTMGTSSADNNLVRVFQTSGFSLSSPRGEWKILRVDRIISMQRTGMHIGTKPISDYDARIPDFNKNDDRSMTDVQHIKRFD